MRVGILFGDNVASLGIVSGTPDNIMRDNLIKVYSLPPNSHGSSCVECNESLLQKWPGVFTVPGALSCFLQQWVQVFQEAKMSNWSD